MHSVVIVGGTAAERGHLVEAFARAAVPATAADSLDSGARPHLLVITGRSAHALVREARLAPHLTDVPIFVVLAEHEAIGGAGSVHGDLYAGDSGDVSEVADDAIVEDVTLETSERAEHRSRPLAPARAVTVSGVAPPPKALGAAPLAPMVAEPVGIDGVDISGAVARLSPLDLAISGEVSSDLSADLSSELSSTLSSATLDESDESTGEHARVRARTTTNSSTTTGRAYDPAALLDLVLEAGATDAIRLPVSPRLLRNRVEMLLTVSRAVDLGPIPPELVRVNDVLTQHGDDAEALVHVLEVLQESLQFERASLIAYIEGSSHGFVIAATDAPTRRQFTLAMAEYPEISHAMKTSAPVLIDDVMTHPLTSRLGDMLAERGVRASAVLPVQWRGRLLGVILLRRSTPGVGHIAGRGIELAQLITSITAAHLRHGAVLASLREQTHRISRDRYEAERRLRGIDSLKEHFEAGTDGVVVLDSGGRILFVNRAAERITGFARDGLIGSLLTELAPFEQRAQIEEATAQVLAGTNVEPFDLSLDTTQHIPVRVSVSTSTVLAGTGAAILSFRDVTAERKLENELRSTKEFLERLIDSTVDAIIAADLHGTIILFNQGAERLFGFRAEDMIGKRPVWDLYDKSAARQIMRMLRSNAYGGGGRLDATRREVKTRSGEVVPVSMSAAIIYEGDEEVATVGILTDLRERIRMEQRLAQAQRQLQLTEKQALVAELAGAAAHELNQPLTSILGYCELLKRQSPPDAAHMRAVGVITGQSERMAAIVKKIGRLTKYETTDYVGTERILDLDRATDDSGLVLDPVEEGKTGEFTAVLPGGLAQALGRDDFDLLWPNGRGRRTTLDEESLLEVAEAAEVGAVDLGKQIERELDESERMRAAAKQAVEEVGVADAGADPDAEPTISGVVSGVVSGIVSSMASNIPSGVITSSSLRGGGAGGAVAAGSGPAGVVSGVVSSGALASEPSGPMRVASLPPPAAVAASGATPGAASAPSPGAASAPSSGAASASSASPEPSSPVPSEISETAVTKAARTSSTTHDLTAAAAAAKAAAKAAVEAAAAAAALAAVPEAELQVEETKPRSK